MSAIMHGKTKVQRRTLQRNRKRQDGEYRYFVNSLSFFIPFWGGKPWTRRKSKRFVACAVQTLLTQFATGLPTANIFARSVSRAEDTRATIGRVNAGEQKSGTFSFACFLPWRALGYSGSF
jgi:hypothetical protein